MREVASAGHGRRAAVIALAACTNPAPSLEQAPSAVALEQVQASPAENVPSALDGMRPRLPGPAGRPRTDPDRWSAARRHPLHRRAALPTSKGREPARRHRGGAGADRRGRDQGVPGAGADSHEIVNDTVGGVPVAATYCPLCNSGITFDRRLDDRVLSFGTSGRLYSRNPMMYDRQTESLWPQLTGRASAGVLTGAQLDAIPMGVVGWQDFRTAFADAWVLSRDTGYARDYSRNLYTGYDALGSEPIFSRPHEDARLDPKTRVIALPWRTGVGDGRPGRGRRQRCRRGDGRRPRPRAVASARTGLRARRSAGRSAAHPGHILRHLLVLLGRVPARHPPDPAEGRLAADGSV